METIFLAKENNTDDRDCVKYIEFCGFECDHYFGGLHIHGACFCGYEKEIREDIKNNYENYTTILSKEEFEHLFDISDRIRALGCGIEKGSEKYNEGMALINEYKTTIEPKLLSEANDELFEKVIKEEKEFVAEEYDLSGDEVDYIFDNYGLEYQDRAIVGCVYDDIDELVENEKWNLGYNDQPYFDDEAFANDLLNDDYYLELESGKIVSYMY